MGFYLGFWVIIFGAPEFTPSKNSPFVFFPSFYRRQSSFHRLNAVPFLTVDRGIDVRFNEYLSAFLEKISFRQYLNLPISDSRLFATPVTNFQKADRQADYRANFRWVDWESRGSGHHTPSCQIYKARRHYERLSFYYKLYQRFLPGMLPVPSYPVYCSIISGGILLGDFSGWFSGRQNWYPVFLRLFSVFLPSLEFMPSS